MLRQISRNGGRRDLALDPFGLVAEMRRYRVQMVQTEVYTRVYAVDWPGASGVYFILILDYICLYIVKGSRKI